MREIPEAIAQAAQLNRLLAGKTIDEARVGESSHGFAWYNDAVSDPSALLVGRAFTGAFALGGILEMRFGKASVALGDGAGPRYWPCAKDAPAKRQLYLSFADGSALTAVVAMYGGIWVFEDGNFDNPFYRGSRDAVSPLSDAFPFERFRALGEGLDAKTSMKAFLATEQRIPGLGNGVLQDILLAAGLHPKARVGSLSEADWHRLYDALRSVLTEMAALGGRDVERDALGEPGRYRTRASRATLGKPCAVCGTPIEKAAYMGGAVYFCPRCQRL